MARRALAFGVATKTGSAVFVALTGTAGAPQFAGRWEVRLVPSDLPAQPYHAAAVLEPSAAEGLIERVGLAAEQAAAAALRSAVDGIPTAAVIGVAVVVKTVSIPAGVTQILRSHAWMHAAEGALYRDAVLDAARSCRWTPHAVDGAALAPSDAEVTALGRVAGRPWRRIEKDATRAGLTLLPTDVPMPHQDVPA